MKNKAGASSNGLDEELQIVIKAASKTLSEAKAVFDKICDETFQELAQRIGYEKPKDAADLILEDLRDSGKFDILHNAQDFELALINYTCRQYLEWEQEELEEQLKALEIKRKSLDSKLNGLL